MHGGHDRTGVVCVFLLLSAATLTEPLEWHGSIIARTVFLCLLSFFPYMHVQPLFYIVRDYCGLHN